MVESELATLHELRTVYSIDDLFNFHELLDYRLECRLPEDAPAVSSPSRPSASAPRRGKRRSRGR